MEVISQEVGELGGTAFPGFLCLSSAISDFPTALEEGLGHTL